MTGNDSIPDQENGFQDSNGSSSSSSTPERDSTSTPVLESYVFPEHRLKTVMDDSSKTPLLLVACGSFSPITYLHLRMFEMAADYAKFSTNFEVVGGYLSPVSDAYKKAGLATADHRYMGLQGTRGNED
jgi:nicotinamide mononucleotide adenylyltransferase